MMVTFVSQCEKKALNRTRRVLDAFANRIGDNTWQTVITQEGLLAVKKLLRKTASKNTAVSCHWIRSRSRSELVWIVGQRDKFNAQGLVPVNTTQKDVFMDITIEKPEKGVLYANTHLQKLDEHLFAVGFITQFLFKTFYPTRNAEIKTAFVAGCFHDVGKIDPAFQSWVTKKEQKDFLPEDGQHIDSKGKFSFETHPRHNEISCLIYQVLDNPSLKTINTSNKKSIKHAVYWHHAKPFRLKGTFETYGDVFDPLNKSLKGSAWKQIILASTGLLKRVCLLDSAYRDTEKSLLSKCFTSDPEVEILSNYEKLCLPNYKEYEANKERLEDFHLATKSNAKNNEIRACLITADRWVSALSAKALSLYISEKSLEQFIDQKLEDQLSHVGNLKAGISEYLSTFPKIDRTLKQAEVASNLAKNNEDISILSGAAGCGKTKIALEWAQLGDAQQIFWICPRVQICQGLFTELTSDQYLPNTTVEIHTGEYKCINSYFKETPESEYFSGDIVITTIDQILSNITSHSKVDRLLNYLNAHVVFDEFHEYINMPGFNLLFPELVASKRKLSAGAKVLLVSATPHYSYLNNLLEISDYDVIEMPSFNLNRYQFDFQVYDEKTSDNNPLYQLREATTFVISNTATTAQKSFIQNQGRENAVLLHSKYKKTDKQHLFNTVFEAFKKDGNCEYSLLRSGPIVQASLNISCNFMVSELTNAENCLQRMGRLDRFGDNNDSVNSYVIAVPETIEQGRGALAKNLSHNKCYHSAKAWYQYLREHSKNGQKAFLLSEIYMLYKKFYLEFPSAKKNIESDLLSSMKAGALLINSKVSEPQIIAVVKDKLNKRKKISRNTLRGESRFVQMALCEVSTPNCPQILNQYAYSIPNTETESVDNLTESLDRLRNNDLINYAAKKHGRIDTTSVISQIPKSKIKLREKLLENYARNPEYPIYVSYTPNELDQKLGEQTTHEEAIYYGVSDKQPIGAISLKHLISKKEESDD